MKKILFTLLIFNILGIETIACSVSIPPIISNTQSPTVRQRYNRLCQICDRAQKAFAADKMFVLILKTDKENFLNTINLQTSMILTQPKSFYGSRYSTILNNIICDLIDEKINNYRHDFKMYCSNTMSEANCKPDVIKSIFE